LNKNKTSPRCAEVQRFEPFASPSPHPHDRGLLRLRPKLTRASWARSLAREIRAVRGHAIFCIIAQDLARTHVSYYNDDAKRTNKGMYRQRIQKAWGHTAHRGWARLQFYQLLAAWGAVGQLKAQWHLAFAVNSAILPPRVNVLLNRLC